MECNFNGNGILNNGTTYISIEITARSWRLLKRLPPEALTWSQHTPGLMAISIGTVHI